MYMSYILTYDNMQILSYILTYDTDGEGINIQIYKNGAQLFFSLYRCQYESSFHDYESP